MAMFEADERDDLAGPALTGDAGEPAEAEDNPFGEDAEEDEAAEVPLTGPRAEVLQALKELEAPQDSDKRWYVIHTYSGYENKVKANLEKRVESMGMADRIFRVVVPTEDQIEIKEGKKRVTTRKIFPGYVLVEMIMSDESWYVVRNTPGVTGFVGAGAKPVPLRAEEVRAILHQMGLEEPRPKIIFDLGESVKVVSGPFQGFVGEVREVYPDKGKLRVFVTMFGRETPVEVDYGQVEKL